MISEKKRAANNEIHRRRYHEWREQGLCGHCGKRWAEAGRSKCRICRLSAIKSMQRPGAKDALREYKANMRKERKENGLCIECGDKLKPEELGVNTKCVRCRKKAMERTTVKRIQMRIHGIKRKR